MRHLLQHARVGLRSLRRTPGFTLAAALTLALGIGLSTAVFTVAEALLLRRLPVPAQDRVVVLHGEMRGFDNLPLTLEHAREVAAGAASLDTAASFASFGAVPVPVRDGDRIARLRRALVTGDFFAVLGARPLLGRALTPGDDVPGAEPVAVLSHGAWQRRYDGRADVLGQPLRMHDDGVAYTIVGVMPPGLDLPRGTDVWAPVARVVPAGNIGYVGFNVVGRLAPAATPEAARGELTAFFRRPEASPMTRDAQGVARTLPQVVLGETRPAVLTFAAASLLLLVITCVNVANLLLVRGLARAREVAVRAALGAHRRQLVAQLLVEHLLLAAAGALLGALVAVAAVRAFVTLAPAGLPRVDEIAPNVTVLLGGAAIAGVALLLFAVAPAIATSRADVQAVLRSGTRQSVGRRSRRVAEVLVAGQVALALLVLSAAGLVARSLVALERAELAFEPSRLLVAELALRQAEYGDAAAQRALLDRLLPAVRAVPGVAAVAPTVAVPFSGGSGWDGRPAREGQSPDEARENPMLNMELVTPDYFATLRVPVVRGRGFTEADREGAPPVVVLSESAARQHWPGEDPVGKRLRMGPPSAPPFTVVGIVPDTRWRALREARPSIYFPLAQSFFPFVPTTLAVRTSVPPTAVVADLRRAIETTAPGVAVAGVAPFASFLDAPLAQPRLNALLLAVFAGAAVTLAAVGLFGVMATMVRSRTRELGVRMALGATAADLRRMVLRRGVAIAAAGAAVGVVGALAANRLLEALLYDVRPTDAATLLAVTALLLGVAVLAALVPARASTRVDPTVALRAEE